MKIANIFILCLFLISLIPFTLAEDTRLSLSNRGSTSNSEDSTDNSDTDDKTKESREALKNQLEEIKEERENLQNLRKEKIKNLEDAKERLQEHKKDLRRACDDNNTDACERAKEQIRNGAKNVLVKVAEKLLTFIERTTLRIETLRLDTPTQTTLLTELASTKKEVLALQEKINALDENANAETYRELSQLLKEEGKELQTTLRDLMQKGLTKKIHDYAQRMHAALTGIAQHIQKLQDKGVDTSKVQILFEELKAELSKVDTLTGEDAAKQLRVAHAKMKEVLHTLRELQQDEMQKKPEETKETKNTEKSQEETKEKIQNNPIPDNTPIASLSAANCDFTLSPGNSFYLSEKKVAYLSHDTTNRELKFVSDETSLEVTYEPVSGYCNKPLGRLALILEGKTNLLYINLDTTSTTYGALTQLVQENPPGVTVTYTDPNTGNVVTTVTQ
ncbi:hypothetical protein J4410_07420 [Candidatus Woesearchaeota archaeon]|nr:hypothetical protein [Candidatus Woesearchaeota archaeon]